MGSFSSTHYHMGQDSFGSGRLATPEPNMLFPERAAPQGVDPAATVTY